MHLLFAGFLFIECMSETIYKHLDVDYEHLHLFQ